MTEVDCGGLHKVHVLYLLFGTGSFAGWQVVEARDAGGLKRAF